MDLISRLPDELLVKILSFLPTKVAITTSILSKQWEFLWMWSPKLEYISRHYSKSKCKRLRCFLGRNIPLHRAPVIESFRLDFLASQFKPEEIKSWVLTAVSRNLQELEISHDDSWNELNILPSSLYTCKSLVTLKLNRPIVVDFPRMACLPSLKNLHLQNVTYLNEEFLQRLLSSCPVLEDLFVKDDNLRKFIIIVPSLQRLTLQIFCNVAELVINTPSLRYLKLDYYNSESHFSIENMPKLKEAYVDVLSFPYIERLLGSITSVKRLTLCQEDYSSKIGYGDGFVFNQLEHLKICLCTRHASHVLVRFLKDSPNLRALDLFEMEHHDRRRMCCWDQPKTVPECMLSSLQTFKWSGYLGRPHERDCVNYFLENARCLKTATILSDPCLVPTLDMIKEFSFSSRASTTCQMFFN